MVIRTALACPSCGKGVITRVKEKEPYFYDVEKCLTIPSHSMPHCTHCHNKFEIKITYDMVIEIMPYP